MNHGPLDVLVPSARAAAGPTAPFSEIALTGVYEISKILATLGREGFVRQDPLTGRFHLGWRLLALAFGHADRVGLPALCLPILQAVADDTDELVQLAIVESDQLLFVAKAEGPGQQMRMLPLVGVAPPIHATASGKAWLAHLPEAEALAIVGRHRLTRLTARTLTSRAKLLAQLRTARVQGYAIVDEELVEGGRAAAAPILVAGRPVGAVAVSGGEARAGLTKDLGLPMPIRMLLAALQSPAPIGADTPGGKIYLQVCAACHMPNGSGVPGMQPALSSNAIVSGDANRLIDVILRGPAAVLPADRERFSNVMPPFSVLSDADIAGVITYLRKNFAPGAAEVTPAQVAARRAKL